MLKFIHRKSSELADLISPLREKKSTVIGSTLNAAFVDEIIKEAFVFHRRKSGVKIKSFRGKYVIQPKDEIETIQTILPYGEQNKKIFEGIKTTLMIDTN